jgi:DNA-binding transcriptional LysR family regulator
MDTRWIEDFQSLAQTRSFSRSADERGVTQSALSKRIRALEQWVGADLIDRRGFPMALTPAGAVFNHAAATAMKTLNDARALLSRQCGQRGMLRIAAGHTLAHAFVPRWLQAAGAGRARLQATVKAANVHDSVLALTEGACDLLVCYHHPDLPVLVDPQQFDSLVVGEDVLLPACVRGRAGGAAFPLPGAQTAPLPLLAYGRDSYFGRVVDYLAARAGPCALSAACESDMADVLKGFAMAGMGVAWLPQSSIEQELRSGSLVAAGGPAWSLRLQIVVVRTRDNTSPALAALWDGWKP